MDYKKKYIKYKLKYLKKQYGGAGVFFLKGIRGEIFTIPMESVTTVSNLKEIIESESADRYLKSGLMNPSLKYYKDDIIIIFIGVVLPNEYNFQDDALFFVPDEKNIREFSRIGKTDTQKDNEIRYTTTNGTTMFINVKLNTKTSDNFEIPRADDVAVSPTDGAVVSASDNP
jgi:hypothetical protein